MGYNNLKEFPEYEYLSQMEKLALLDCTNNQIEVLHPFGKNVNLTKFYLDYNKIDSIPGHLEADGYKYFFGYYDVELFSCANNKLKLVPDVFNAKSVNVMASVDFSYNEIEGFEDGDDHRGIEQNDIADNHLEHVVENRLTRADRARQRNTVSAEPAERLQRVNIDHIDLYTRELGDVV